MTLQLAATAPASARVRDEDSAHRPTWISRIAKTQIRQILITGDVVAALHAVVGASSDRDTLTHAARTYTAAITPAAPHLGAADRLEATRRLGPVFPGTRNVEGGRAVSTVLTAALIHAAFDDLQVAMSPELRATHRVFGTKLAELDRFIDQLNDSSYRSVAVKVSTGWTGTFAELGAVADGVTAAPRHRA